MIKIFGSRSQLDYCSYSDNSDKMPFQHQNTHSELNNVCGAIVNCSWWEIDCLIRSISWQKYDHIVAVWLLCTASLQNHSLEKKEDWEAKRNWSQIFPFDFNGRQASASSPQMLLDEIQVAGCHLYLSDHLSPLISACPIRFGRIGSLLVLWI